MSQTSKELLDEYRRQFKAHASTADKSLLVELRQTLNERLQLHPLNSEDVHVASDFSLYFGGDRSALIDTLNRYLSQSLSADEEGWARWKLVDNLALLERCAEVVQYQQQFFDWAREALTGDQLLWVMYDSTQALCWVQVGRGNEWLQHFSNLMATVSPTRENRRNRLVYLESAAVVLNKLGNSEEMWLIARSIEKLSEEDRDWEKALEAKLTSFQVAINAYSATENEEGIFHVAKQATTLLEDQWQNSSTMALSQKRKLFVLYHNMGGTLYLTRQYDLAIPLLRRAVELNSFVEHTYLWLAASLWRTTKNRDEVLALLKEGAHRAMGSAGVASRGYDRWRQLPEFEDVKNDSEFLSAVA